MRRMGNKVRLNLEHMALYLLVELWNVRDKYGCGYPRHTKTGIIRRKTGVLTHRDKNTKPE